MKRFMVDLLFVHRLSWGGPAAPTVPVQDLRAGGVQVRGSSLCTLHSALFLFPLPLFLVMLHMVLIVIIVIVIAVSVAFVVLGNAV